MVDVQHDLENPGLLCSSLQSAGEKKTCSVFLQSAIGGKTEFPAFGSAPPVVSNRRPAAAVGHTAAQEGIIPLFLLRSAMVRRL